MCRLIFRNFQEANFVCITLILGTIIESPVKTHHHKSVCSSLKKPSLPNSEDSFKYKRHLRANTHALTSKGDISNPFSTHNLLKSNK